MFNLIIFGAPGSGKGTQSENLISHYNLTHISTGDLLRRMIAQGTPLGKTAESYISKGHLIPDDLMVKILEHEIKSLEGQSQGFIFDGFPRTLPQAKALKEMLAKHGHSIHSVVHLDVDVPELERRLIERGKTSGRSDDNPTAIKERLKVYMDETSPLKDYYKSEGILRSIPGEGQVDEVFSRICNAVDNA